MMDKTYFDVYYEQCCEKAIIFLQYIISDS